MFGRGCDWRVFDRTTLEELPIRDLPDMRSIPGVGLTSRNSIELMDDNASRGIPGGPYLGREFLSRSADGSNGDPGTFVRLDTLPQSTPKC